MTRFAKGIKTWSDTLLQNWGIPGCSSRKKCHDAKALLKHASRWSGTGADRLGEEPCPLGHCCFIPISARYSTKLGPVDTSMLQH